MEVDHEYKGQPQECKNCDKDCPVAVIRYLRNKGSEWVHLYADGPEEEVVVQKGCPYCGCTRPEPMDVKL